MVIGVRGLFGRIVMSPVVLEYKRGHEHVIIQILNLMVSIVQEMTYKHRIVVQLHVQV